MKIKIHHVKPSTVHLNPLNNESQKFTTDSSKKSTKNSSQNSSANSSQKFRTSQKSADLQTLLTQTNEHEGGAYTHLLEDSTQLDETIPSLEDLQNVGIDEERKSSSRESSPPREPPIQSPIQKTPRKMKRRIIPHQSNELDEEDQTKMKGRITQKKEGKQSNELDEEDQTNEDNNESEEEDSGEPFNIHNTDFFERFKIREHWFRIPLGFSFKLQDNKWVTQVEDNTSWIYYKDNFQRHSTLNE